VTCKLCQENPIVTNVGGWPIANRPPRKCAFRDGVFNPANWNCGTLITLRADNGDEWAFSKKPGYAHGEDQSCYTKHVGHGFFLVLGWYKDRGRTEYAGILDGEKMQPLRLDQAEAILAGRSLAELQ
jgi:hypothetical protein